MNEFPNSESHLSKVNAVLVTKKYFSCVKSARTVFPDIPTACCACLRSRELVSTRGLRCSGYSSARIAAAELSLYGNEISESRNISSLELCTEVKLVILKLLMFSRSLQEKNE